EDLTTDIVKEISFSLYPGEVIAITGLVGAGRTELVEALFGVQPIRKGSVRLEGQEIKITEPKKAIQHGLGLVPEGRKIQGIYRQRSVKENMTIAHLPRITRSLFIKGK